MLVAWVWSLPIPGGLEPCLEGSISSLEVADPALGGPSQSSGVPYHPQGSRTLPWASDAILRGPQCLRGFQSCAGSLSGLEGPRPCLRVRIQLADVSWEMTAEPTVQQTERRAGFKQRPFHPHRCRLHPPGKVQNSCS